MMAGRLFNLLKKRPGFPIWNITRARVLDAVIRYWSLGILIITVGVLLAIPLYIFREAYPLVKERNIIAFLIREPWTPLADPPLLGIVHAWVSTLFITGLALLFAVPTGFGIGIFVSEYAPLLLRSVLQPCLELLAGIPSVVYGFFGYITVCNWLEKFFDLPTGESVLAASLILAIMVLPFIAGTSAEVFRSIDREFTEAGLSLGVTRSHVIRRIIFPKAAPGMFAAVALGLARAVGETFAVMILAGNSVAIPGSWLERGQPLTALIATELGEAGVGSPKYHSLFFAGLILMLVVIIINILIWGLKKRLVLNEN